MRPAVPCEHRALSSHFLCLQRPGKEGEAVSAPLSCRGQRAAVSRRAGPQESKPSAPFLLISWPLPPPPNAVKPSAGPGWHGQACSLGEASR